jgi:tubby-related protein 1
MSGTDKKGPCACDVHIPKVHEDGQSQAFQPRTSHSDDQDSILEKFRMGSTENIIELNNVRPKWNRVVEAYVLNFNGRVTMASVKNFQISIKGGDDTVLLQFGKVGKDTFNVDMRYPMTPFQAFGICLSCFDFHSGR